MSAKPRISYSQISAFEACGYRYWLRYLEGSPRPPKGLWSPLGRSVDEGVGLALQARMAGLTANHVGLATRNAFDRILSEEEIDTESEAKVREARSMAIKLAELYARDVAPLTFPWKVQERLEVETPDYIMVAVLDALERVDTPWAGMVYQVRDTKTRTGAPPADAAQRSLQLRIYGWAVRETYHALPAGGVLDFLLKQDSPAHHMISTAFTDAGVDVVDMHAEALLAARESGVFPPASPDSWQCSARHCEYFHSCPYALRPCSAAVPEQYQPQGGKPE